MLEIMLIILLGIAAAGVFIWLMVRQFKGKNICTGCYFSNSCMKESINKNKCK
jgi:hypothetical protein